MKAGKERRLDVDNVQEMVKNDSVASEFDVVIDGDDGWTDTDDVSELGSEDSCSTDEGSSDGDD